jgi:DNA-binding NarL/FixJ family response regulator
MVLAAARTAIVADTHPLSLDALARVVLELGIKVSARETRLGRVADLVERHHPDLLILGVDEVDAEFQGLLRVVQGTDAEVRVVVIGDEDPRRAQVAFAAGAHAYCDRTASADDLAAAIRQAFERSIYLPPLLVDPATSETAYATPPYLTQREVEILRLVAEGRTNKEIAGSLWVTPNTVKFHLSNVYGKLHVANRAEATRWAERRGLLDKR